MDLNKVKQLVKTVGGRCLLIDGNDVFVIMGIDEYKKLTLFRGYRNEKIGDLSESGLLDKINQDIDTWQESQSENKASEVEQELPEEDIQIERVLF